MYKIVLANDFLHGPIWVYADDGIAVRHYPLVNDDEELKKLDKEMCQLYSSYYSFNTPNAACEFSYEAEWENRDRMLSIIKKIEDRLNEIIDGSFVIENLITPYLEGLTGPRQPEPEPEIVRSEPIEPKEDKPKARRFSIFNLFRRRK